MGVGTETDGSIVSPASINGLVGLKPTVGRISRDGVIPISHTQDTAGPMTRTVADAAMLFAAMAGLDAADRATAQAPGAGTGTGIGASRSTGNRSGVGTSTSTRSGGGTGAPADAGSDVRTAPAAWAAPTVEAGSGPGRMDAVSPASLPADALQGARLGIARAYLTRWDEADAVFARAVEQLRAAGAEIVDDIELPAVGYGDAELSVLLHEFKQGLGVWLRQFAPQAPVRSLAELIAWNEAHRGREMPWFGQELFEQAQALGGLDSAAYRTALEACARGARTEGLDPVFARHRLDAVIAPTGSVAWLIDPVAGDHYGASFSTPAAVAGYPHLTVPMGLVRGLPLGLSFVGPAWSEWRLLALGAAYEQATRERRPPTYRRRSVPA